MLPEHGAGAVYSKYGPRKHRYKSDINGHCPLCHLDLPLTVEIDSRAIKERCEPKIASGLFAHGAVMAMIGFLGHFYCVQTILRLELVTS